MPPHPVDCRPAALRAAASCIVYIASEYSPNVDAIRHFLAECWPEIQSKHSVTMNIYGNVCQHLETVSGVCLKGFVPDLTTVYAEADIVINPVRFGAGLKIKNLEALGSGLPLVTTSHGARGLEEGAGTAFLTADSPKDFARAVSELLSDAAMRRRLGSEALQLVRKQFSADTCFQPLLDALYSA